MRSVVPDRDLHRDMRGRFTKKGFSRCRAGFLYLFGLLTVPSRSRRLPQPIRAFRRWTGATSLLEALVRAWDGVGFHTAAPPLGGSLPSIISPCGKALEPERKPEAALLR